MAKRCTLLDDLLAYKVVTGDLKSLGLRRNPTILHYPIGHWVDLDPCDIIKGKQDAGGIWVARSYSGATTLRNYMLSKYDTHTRIFLCDIRDILYVNSYRIKTSGVRLVQEL